MRTRFLTILFLLVPVVLAAQTSADSLALSQVDWQWKELGNGAQSGHAQFEIFGATRNISIVRYPAKKFRTDIIHQTGELAAGTDSLAKRVGARFALNGSFFNMSKLTPTTYFTLAREILYAPEGELTDRDNAVVAVKKKNGRKISIFPISTADFATVSKKYYAALAAGPLLMLDGEIVPNNTESSFNATEHPRSIIGLTSDGWVYLVVSDGRMAPDATGMSVAQESAFCKWMGMKDALNLDGGGSSAVWTDIDGVVNCPCDNKKFDHKGVRRVPNAIVVFDR